MTILVSLILIGSMMFSPISTSEGQVADEVIKTGDTFDYKLNSSSWEDQWSDFDIYNVSNPSQSFRYEEDMRTFDGTGSGDMNMFAIRTGSQEDTILLIESQQTVTSKGGGERILWDAGMNQGQGGWDNMTEAPWTDTHYEDHDDQFETWSNGTYSIIPPEMDESEIEVPFHMELPFDDSNQGPPPLSLSQSDQGPPLAQLTSRYLTQWDDTYNINGATRNLAVTSVTSEFEFIHTDTYFVDVPLGDNPDDPNTLRVKYNVTLDFYYYAYFEFVFDDATGLLVEIFQDEYVDSFVTMFNNSFAMPMGGPGPQPNQAPQQITAGSEGNYYTMWSHAQDMVLTDALSHYGNTRPQSEGTNRIQEGDQVMFSVDSHSEDSMNFEVKVGTDMHHEVRSNEGTSDSTGTFSVNVYRHKPNQFWAYNLEVGTQTGSWSEDYARYDYGSNNWMNDTKSETKTGGVYRFDAWDSISNASYEIEPFVSDYMSLHFDDDENGDGDKGDDCNGFDIPIPDEMPFVKLESETIYEHYDINTRDYYLEAELIRAIYKLESTSTFDLRLGDCNDPNPLIVTTNLVVVAKGSEEWVYDRWENEGVLLEYYQELSIEVSYNFDGTGMATGGPVDVYVDGEMHAYMDNSIVIDNYPNGYNATQTTTPTPPVTNTTDTNTTTSSTTPKDSDDTSSDGPALPVQVLPFAIGLLVVSIIYSKKKRLL